MEHWLDKYDDPSVEVSVEEIEAWDPIEEAKAAVTRSVEILSVFVAGMNNPERPEFATPAARKIRTLYRGRVKSWRAATEKNEWAPPVPSDEELGIEEDVASGEALRRFNDFDLDWFRDVTVGEIERTALVGVRRAKADLPRHRITNRVISRVAPEAAGLREAAAGLVSP